MKKLIVITGASSGIGKAVAQKFSQEGHPLLLLARRLENMEELNLPNTICQKVDILDLDSFKNAINLAVDKFGEVDCLVNNAGVMLLDHASTQSPKEWHTMIDVNVKGLLNGIHLVLDPMVKRNGGTIINVSSIAGRKTFPSHAIYCGTKFGVHAITEAIREEVSSSNVRVSVISPGVVETELMNHTTNSEIVKNYNQWKKTMGVGLSSLDVANAVFYVYSQPQEVCIREIALAPTKQNA